MKYAKAEVKRSNTRYGVRTASCRKRNTYCGRTRQQHHIAQQHSHKSYNNTSQAAQNRRVRIPCKHAAVGSAPNLTLQRSQRFPHATSVSVSKTAITTCKVTGLQESGAQSSEMWRLYDGTQAAARAGRTQPAQTNSANAPTYLVKMTVL